VTKSAENFAKRADIQRLYRLGLSQREIAARLGISRSSVQRVVAQLGQVAQNAGQVAQSGPEVDQDDDITVAGLMAGIVARAAEDADAFRAYVMEHYDETRPGGWDAW
jgi:DNA invertase Pin-like site-specific DNA recombinase